MPFPSKPNVSTLSLHPDSLDKAIFARKRVAFANYNANHALGPRNFVPLSFIGLNEEQAQDPTEEAEEKVLVYISLTLGPVDKPSILFLDWARMQTLSRESYYKGSFRRQSTPATPQKGAVLHRSTWRSGSGTAGGCKVTKGESSSSTFSSTDLPDQKVSPLSSQGFPLL